MNCEECREELAAYLEGLLDETRQAEIDSHLAGCCSCQAELEEVRQLTVRLAAQQRDRVSDSRVGWDVVLETAVMDRILNLQALEIRRLKMRKRIRMLGISGAMAAAIAVLLVSSFWFAQPAAAEKTAAEVLGTGRRSHAETLNRPYRGQDADHRARQLLLDRRRL